MMHRSGEFRAFLIVDHSSPPGDHCRYTACSEVEMDQQTGFRQYQRRIADRQGPVRFKFQWSLRAMLILACGFALGLFQLTYESAETEIAYTAYVDVSGRTVTPSDVQSRGPSQVYNLDPRSFTGVHVGWPFPYVQFGSSNGITYDGEFNDYNWVNGWAVGLNLSITMVATCLAFVANSMLENHANSAV